MTVYVDDLLLSGPAGSHDEFWQLLNKSIDIDEPELLDKFLNREHTPMQ